MCDDSIPFSCMPSEDIVLLNASKGFKTFHFGPISVTALYDGHFPLITQAVLRADTTPLSNLLESTGLGEVVVSHVNAFLIDNGTHRILIDAGAGSLQDATLGKMRDHIMLAGYHAEDINTVLVTHLHPDHIGGLSQEGRAVFPDAHVYVPREEANFWWDGQHQSHVDPSVRDTFKHARTILEPYIADGRCDFFEHGMSWYGVLFSEQLSGHTRGHSGYRLRTEDQDIVFCGDLFHVMPIQLAMPNVTVCYDDNPREARATRLRFLESCAATGSITAAAHAPFPGLGTIDEAAAGYSWRPLAG